MLTGQKSRVPFWCAPPGYERWGTLTMSLWGKHRPGQWPPMWDDRLSCWCRWFLEVRARHDWKHSLPLTWNICRDTLLRGGDSIKNSADNCRRRLPLLSHQQSHFHWMVFQLRRCCLHHLVPHFPLTGTEEVFTLIKDYSFICFPVSSLQYDSHLLCPSLLCVEDEEILTFCSLSSVYRLTLEGHGSSATINNNDNCCLDSDYVGV